MKLIRFSLFVLVIVFVVTWQPGTAASVTYQAAGIIVSPSGPVTTISKALEKASDGDTILVTTGTYKEEIIIEKSIELIGEGWPIIDGGGNGTVVTLKANGIHMSGFEIRGSGIEPDRDHAGITLEASNIYVENNRLTDVLFGIFVAGADSAVVRNNSITSKDVYDLARKGDGIRIWYSQNVLVEGNKVYNARDVVAWYANGLIFRNNDIVNGRYGIHLMYCDQAEISTNRLKGNSVGVYTMYSKNVKIDHNDIRLQRGPSGYALGFKDATNVTITKNLLIDNRAGIYIDGTPYGPGSYARIDQNIFAYNDIGVLMLSFVKGSEFTNNTFWENIQQVALQGAGKAGENLWMKNYWSDYSGFDANNDGIGDIVYRSERFFEVLTDQEPLLRALQFSPAVQAMEFAATSFPIIKPQPKLEDIQPSVFPATIPASAFSGNDIQSAAGLGLVGIGLLILGIGGGLAARNKGEFVLKKEKNKLETNTSLYWTAHTGRPLVKINNLTKQYGNLVVLKDFDMEIFAGQSVALWGENGAGKTTLLKAMLGLIDARGDVLIDGLDIRKNGKSSRAKIGYVPQEAVYYDMTVKSTLAFYSKIKKVGPGRISVLVKKMGLATHINKTVPALSGGLKQRLALAIALLSDPPLLLLDEPTANLDAQARKDYLTLLGDLRKEGKTIIFASHRIEEAEILADKVIILEQGKKVSEISSGEIRMLMNPEVALTLWVGEEQRIEVLNSLIRRGWRAHLNGRGTVVVELTAAEKVKALQYLVDQGFTISDFEVDGVDTSWN